MSPLSGSVAGMVITSTPLTLFSAMTPLYEDSVRLGASFTLTTVIVTLAFAVSPYKKNDKDFIKILTISSRSRPTLLRHRYFLITEETRKKPFYQVTKLNF